MHDQQFTLPGFQNKPICIDLLSNSPSPKPLVIFVHGFKGFKDWGTHHLVGEYFNAQGFNFLKFNFSHNGISGNSGDLFNDLEAFANNTFSKEISDLREIIRFAVSGEKFESPSHLFLVGHSLGGAISLIEASNNEAVKGLATWASIRNFHELWPREKEEEWRKEGLSYLENSRPTQQMPIYSSLLDDLAEHMQQLDVRKAATELSKPWLIIHGDSDTSVPCEYAAVLHSYQVSSELLILPAADHVFNAKHPWNNSHLPEALKQACDATIGFFKKHMP